MKERKKKNEISERELLAFLSLVSSFRTKPTLRRLNNVRNAVLDAFFPRELDGSMLQCMHVVRIFATQNLQFLYIVEQNLQNISIYIYNTDAMITNDPPSPLTRLDI